MHRLFAQHVWRGDGNGLVGDGRGCGESRPGDAFLSWTDYTSKDLWRQVKAVVRSIERDEGVLIFDDTIQEKAWTDENEWMCWQFLSMYDVFKLECLKVTHKLNHFALRFKIYIKAIKLAYDELLAMRAAA